MKWYEVCSNVTNFKGLMTETGYEKYYDSIYGGLSYETHAYNSTMDISFNENGMCLKPIRNPVDGGSTFSLTCTFSMGLLFYCIFDIAIVINIIKKVVKGI